MAATLTQERFAGPEWIFERKLDGIRLLAFKNGQRRPAAVAQPARPRTCPRSPGRSRSCRCATSILDGEVTWAGTAYHVFDVVWLDGRDLTSLPLEERRALLAACRCDSPLQRVPSLDDESPGSAPAARAGRA